MLAHSHSWKSERSTPIENIENSLLEHDSEFVTHPIQCVDFICVADLATWHPIKTTYLSPKLPMLSYLRSVGNGEGYGMSGFIHAAIGQEKQHEFFYPIGAILCGLYSKLSWTFPDMRNLAAYFGGVKLHGTGFGEIKTRQWPISIYSEKCRERIFNGNLSNGAPYDEWSLVFT